VNPVDKARVGLAFSRGARVYDREARVQRDVQDATLAAVLAHGPAAGRVLDVGAGTGALLARLATARPALVPFALDLAPGMCAACRATVRHAGVAAADAERLPIRDGSVDVVVSTSALQWLPSPDAALAEARRVLRPGGLLAIALFGARTLHELRSAWLETAPGHARTHRFPALAELEASLAGAGFRQAALREEERVEHHPDARAVVRALKAIGASPAIPGRSGLGGRRATLAALDRYEARHAGPRGTPATWHVLHALARAP
jgi:malonyl-CoA O-methyltransferase